MTPLPANYPISGTLGARIDTMSRDELGLLLLDCALVVGVTARFDDDEKPEALIGAAKHYGVSLAPTTADEVQTPAKTSDLPHPPAAQAQGGAVVDDDDDEDGEDEPAESAAAPAPAKMLPVAAWPFPTKPPGATPSTAARAQGKAPPAKRAQTAEQPGGAAAQKVKVDDDGLAAAVGSSAAAAASEEAEA
jgi:hypothetical protein